MNDITVIRFTNCDKFTIVSMEDYEKLSKYKWRYRGNYVVTFNKYRTYQMHRIIMGLTLHDGKTVDHINGNPLDNRRCNLRLVTTSQNNMNRKKMDLCSSKYKGVSFFKRDKNWKASIKVNNINIHLGVFDREEEAALAYNNAAIKHFKEHANLNTIKIN